MSNTEFRKRRQQIMREMGSDSIAIIPSASERMRNRDVGYPFRQDSDFLYLTDFNEPDALAVFVPGRKQGEYILFCREKNPEQEIWHGRRAGQEGACEIYGADDSFPIDDLDEILPGLLENKDKVYYTMGRFPDLDKHMLDWINKVKGNVRSGVHAPNEIVSLEYIVHEMRLFKSKSEITLMRKAAKITANAHINAMRTCKPGMNEYEIEAEFIYEFHKNGGETAYECIVGGGENACILHYRSNDAVLKDGDLLLIDAGSEYKGYASDVTRTFPVNGKYSEAQREIYELVLEAQSAAIQSAKPGNHWNDPHDTAVKILTKGLVELGLLKGAVNQLIKDGAYKKYYMHRTGHWIGMDVHDVGDYKVHGEWRLLEPGIVMTIEPGLYFTPDKDVPKRFHNIGVRIEDDVLITREGNEVLTASIPKTIKEIEAVMSSA